MSYKRLIDPKTGGIYSFVEPEDFEFVDPNRHTHIKFLENSVNFDRDHLLLNGVKLPIKMLNDYLLKRAEERWQKKYSQIQASIVSENLYQLFESNSKKDQIKLLKGLSLSIDQLMHFIFFASKKFGYSFSQYHSEHIPADLDKSQMPTLIHKKSNSEIQKVGNTNLSDGQMKRIIEQRSVKVSKFIDKGDNWHCFFLTYNSIGGKEAYKEGQSHFHYISNYWGLKRDFVLNELRSKNYKLPSLPHIDFERLINDKCFSSSNE